MVHQVTAPNSNGYPLVSVIVPAHNCGDYLGDALGSLVAQTLSDIEIIVVDDGSSDATLSIAEQFAGSDPRVRVIHNPTPSGRPAFARNMGLRHAAGAYIAFLDADDIALPTRLASAVAAITRSGASLAFADFVRFTRDTGDEGQTRLQQLRFLQRAETYLSPIGSDTYACSPRFVGYMLTDMVAVSVQTVVFARTLLDAQPLWFDESLVGGEDLDLFFRLAETATIVFVDAVHTRMRVRADSLTAARTERCVVDAIAVRRRTLKRLRPILSRDEYNAGRRGVAQSFLDLGYDYWVHGRLKDARAAHRDSWRVRRSAMAVVGYAKALTRRTTLVQLKSGILRADT